MSGRNRLPGADLLTDVEDWAAGRGVEVNLFVVDAVLGWHEAVGGGAFRWDAAGVREVLLEWFPHEVTMERSEWPQVLTTLHHWVDFLAEAAGGDEAGLHAVIDGEAEAFLRAMGDERNYGLAKFWATRMVEHGVDLSDGEAVQRFLTAVNSGEVEFDRAVLDEIMARRAGEAGLEFEGPEPLPVVVLPSADEVAESARGAVALGWLRALVEWVGEGRTLTAGKGLRQGDARDLLARLGVDASLLVAWGRAARLVRVVKGRLVPVKAATGLLGDPVRLWQRAFTSFPEIGRSLPRPDRAVDPMSVLRYFLPSVLPEMLLQLYIAGATPVPVELLFTGLDELIFGDVETDRDELWTVLRTMEALGALVLTTSTDQRELAKIAELAEVDAPDPALVALTPLGIWGTREVLRAEGHQAPTHDEVARLPLSQVIDAVLDSPAEVVDPVLTAWAASRGEEEAAGDAASAIVAGASASARLMAWSALELTGPHGAARARELRAAGGVAGAMAASYLVRLGELAEDATETREMLLALAESLAATHDHGLLVEELTQHPVEDQLHLVQGLREVAHPDGAGMLATIRDEHPDPVVAKAAHVLSPV
ncbi:hypothetical protein [Actinokineospora pegani]|uniref:hypothetical protein n=1 Tax=Actinokineospora pegani TaxID=2654637 RepID=UPI0012EA614C|nr:hypothetical protein [Actinokineospora pegani]